MKWKEAVKAALRRMLARHPSGIITLRELTECELSQIIKDTNSRGKTPERSLQRELQELRDLGVLEFMDPGTYRILGGL